MSNVPRESPSAPGKGNPSGKIRPLVPITCRVNALLRVNSVNDRVKLEQGDIVVLLGNEPGRIGRNHTVTLYGKWSVLLDPNRTSIVGKIVQLHVQLLSTPQPTDFEEDESERVGNIESFLGYYDENNRLIF